MANADGPVMHSAATSNNPVTVLNIPDAPIPSVFESIIGLLSLYSDKATGYLRQSFRKNR
jgi:hypothetical protein